MGSQRLLCPEQPQTKNKNNSQTEEKPLLLKKINLGNLHLADMIANLVHQLSLPGVDVPLTCQQDGDPRGGKAECPPWGAHMLVSCHSCGLHPAAHDLAVSYAFILFHGKSKL